MELFKNKYFIIAAGIVSVLVIIAVGIGFVSLMKDNSGTSSVADSGSLDQSKEVKSNVGDTNLGDGAMKLDGVSVGGNVGQIGSNTNTDTKNESSSESSEDNSKK